MKKTILLTTVLLVTVAFSGCGFSGEDATKKEETINPFSVDSMVNTYDNSKERINETVEKENDKINKALEESGLVE